MKTLITSLLLTVTSCLLTAADLTYTDLPQDNDSSTKLSQRTAYYTGTVAMQVGKSVSVVPYTTTSALADGNSMSYLFDIPCCRAAGFGFWLQGIHVITTEDISSTKPDFELLIFSDSVTAGNPAAAMAISDGDIAKQVAGPFRFTEGMWAAYGALNGSATTNGLAFYMLPASGTSLKGLLRARKTYTAAATNTFRVNLFGLQD